MRQTVETITGCMIDFYMYHIHTAEELLEARKNFLDMIIGNYMEDRLTDDEMAVLVEDNLRYWLEAKKMIEEA